MVFFSSHQLFAPSHGERLQQHCRFRERDRNDIARPDPTRRTISRRSTKAPVPTEQNTASAATFPDARGEGVRCLMLFRRQPRSKTLECRRSFRRPTKSYPTCRQLDSTVRQLLPGHPKFRVLVVGKRRSGKSSLIETVFKVDVTAAPARADINFGFCPEDNRYLIVHECSGLDSQAGDSQDLQVIRDFISRRTDPSSSPSERLHAIWICVPASDAIAGRLGDGVEEILGLRNVPVVLVFTEFDVVVSQVLSEIAGGGAQYHGHARAGALTMLEDSCRRLFHKDLRDVPAAIVSEKSIFIDLVNNLIVTTDSLITDSHALSAGSGSAVPLTWSAALRVNHDIIIQASIAYVVFVSPLTVLIVCSHPRVGQNRYWRSLWSSPDFANHTLKDCINVIHSDIVEIWNLNDITGYLSSDRFKVKMSHIVKDLAGSANTTSGAGDDFADWVNDVYSGSQENVRCLMGYIVDLMVILYGSFRLAAGDMSPKCARQVLERHVESRHKDLIHRDIENFTAEVFATRFSAPQNDLVLERIIGLIKQYSVPPSEIEVEVE
ncbi:hypothetical protein V8E53_003714 [Lactarius tabidus]